MASPTFQNRLAGAASGEEAKFFRDLSQKFAGRVSDNARMGFRFGEDSDGQPAVWVTLYVPSDLDPNPRTVGNLKRISEDIRTEILSSEFERWPYVQIRTE